VAGLKPARPSHTCLAWRCSGHKSTCFGPLKTTAPSEGRAHVTRPPASPRTRNTPRSARAAHDTSARAYQPPRRDPSTAAAHMGPEARSGARRQPQPLAPASTPALLPPSQAAGSLRGGRARSPDGGRGTRMFPFISIVFTIKLLTRMPLRPAPAQARAAFSPKVPSGLTGRAPAWGGGPEWLLPLPVAWAPGCGTARCADKAVQSAPAPSSGSRTRSSWASSPRTCTRRRSGLHRACEDVRGS